MFNIVKIVQHVVRTQTHTLFINHGRLVKVTRSRLRGALFLFVRSRLAADATLRAVG